MLLARSWFKRVHFARLRCPFVIPAYLSPRRRWAGIQHRAEQERNPKQPRAETLLPCGNDRRTERHLAAPRVASKRV